MLWGTSTKKIVMLKLRGYFIMFYPSEGHLGAPCNTQNVEAFSYIKLERQKKSNFRGCNQVCVYRLDFALCWPQSETARRKKEKKPSKEVDTEEV